MRHFWFILNTVNSMNLLFDRFSTIVSGNSTLFYFDLGWQQKRKLQEFFYRKREKKVEIGCDDF